MDKLKQIDEAIRKFNINKKDILPEILKKFEEDFAIRFTYESLKMEGSSLTFEEVKDLLAKITSQTDKE